MKIKDIKVLVSCPGRNFVTVKIITEDGVYGLGDAPGLGVDFDEDAAKEFPYKRSYLPISRLEDGTLWNW